MAYNPRINGVYWGYNPLTNHLLTSWDILVSLDIQANTFLGLRCLIGYILGVQSPNDTFSSVTRCSPGCRSGITGHVFFGCRSFVPWNQRSDGFCGILLMIRVPTVHLGAHGANC